MTPDKGLVENLRRLDPDLRLRWGRHQHKWMIELRVPEQHPSWVQERPTVESNDDPRYLDVQEGWKDGYVYVTMLPHPIPYPWDFIAAHLKHLSLRAHRAKDRLVERLEEAEAKDQASKWREWVNVNEAASKDLYDMLAWDQGRTVSLAEVGPSVREEAREGYVVLDRRVKVA